MIDISGHKILVEGKEVDLTASEFKLLTTLARHPGRVYNRMELVEKVLETIAHAVDGVEPLGLLGIVAQLGAQILDVTVNRALVTVKVVAEDLLHQLHPVVHATRMTGCLLYTSRCV